MMRLTMAAITLMLGFAMAKPAITATDNIDEMFDYKMKSVAIGTVVQQSPPQKDETESSETEAYSTNAQADLLTHEYRMTQNRYKLYECIALAASVVISLVIVLTFIRKNEALASHIVHASGLVFIIFGTIFLVILAGAESQLTAAMGIMGAIAGYLFGKLNTSDSKK